MFAQLQVHLWDEVVCSWYHPILKSKIDFLNLFLTLKPEKRLLFLARTPACEIQ